MPRHFTINDLKSSKVAGLNKYLIDQLEGVKINKESKYGNKKCVVDGIQFDSGKEAVRYGTLRLMEKAGIIADLRLQVEYELNQGGTHSLKYIADFVYREVESGKVVVEDAKGFRTREYKKKCRLMKKLYGIQILET